jgi:hypothetical protein
MKNNNKDIIKVAAFGKFPVCFHLNLTREEMNTLKLNIHEIDALTDYNKIIDSTTVKKKIYINSNFFLSNLLIFFNKTCVNIKNIEYITLNNLSNLGNFQFLVDMIEENNLLIKPLNIQHNYCSLNINIEGNEKVFIEGNGLSHNTKRKGDWLADINKSNLLKQMVNDAYILSNTKNNSMMTKPYKIKDKIIDKLSNLFSSNKICFFNCDALFLDLNEFTHNKSISLIDVYQYIISIFENKKNKCAIILFFPDSTNFSLIHVPHLTNLINIAEYVIFEKNDLQVFLSLIETPEVHDIYGRLKGIKSKSQLLSSKRTILIKNEFYQFTVFSEDNDYNMLEYKKEYQFNYGYKIEYAKVIASNYMYLKSVFYGGFFSSIFTGFDYDVAFIVGKNSVEKMMTLLYQNTPFPLDFSFLKPNYKINSRVKSVEASKNERLKNPSEERRKETSLNSSYYADLNTKNERKSLFKSVKGNKGLDFKSNMSFLPYNTLRPFEKFSTIDEKRFNPKTKSSSNLPNLNNTLKLNSINKFNILNNSIKPLSIIPPEEEKDKAKTLVVDNFSSIKSLATSNKSNKTKSSSNIKKYIIKLDDGKPLKPEVLLNKPKQILEFNEEKGNRRRNMINDNNRRIRSKKTRLSLDIPIKNSPIKPRYGGVTLVIQDL